MGMFRSFITRINQSKVFVQLNRENRHSFQTVALHRHEFVSVGRNCERLIPESEEEQ